jgi:mannose-6-phosphate isomerase-like protein (cupin superfamily)
MIVNQNRVNKPWGHEIIWSKCDKFVGKILCINKDQKLSRQYHKQKEETIFVLSGALLLEVGMGEKMEQIILKRGQSFHITPGTIHRFIAGFGDVELAEVSTPELEDVVRLEDDYSRVI